jgi:hypothetical protein
MPWLETDPMEQRERFLTDHRRALYSMAELCARYGISRKTGYKWLERYETEGRAGLQDRSHAPHHCPHKIGPKMAIYTLPRDQVDEGEGAAVISGTPVLSTRLVSMTDEYSPYVYWIDDDSPAGIRRALCDVLRLPLDERLTKGRRA